MGSLFPNPEMMSSFKFEKKLAELESFAADLFREYNQAFLQRRLETS